MADKADPIMTMVENELKKKPDITTTELYEKAKAIDPKIGEMSVRQFNGRYPLQVKRRLKAAPAAKPPKAEPARRRARAPRKEAARKAAPRQRRKPGRRAAAAVEAEAGVNRDAIRGVLLQFAEDLAAAKDDRAMIRLIGGLDKYVDRVAKAASR